MNVDMDEKQILYVATRHFNKAESILHCCASTLHNPNAGKKAALEAVQELKEALRLFEVTVKQRGGEA